MAMNTTLCLSNANCRATALLSITILLTSAQDAPLASTMTKFGRTATTVLFPIARLAKRMALSHPTAVPAKTGMYLISMATAREAVETIHTLTKTDQLASLALQDNSTTRLHPAARRAHTLAMRAN